MSNFQAISPDLCNQFASTHDVLGDFDTQTIQLPTMVVKKGKDAHVLPLVYIQSDLDRSDLVIGKVKITSSVNASNKPKQFVGIMENGKSVWLDQFANYHKGANLSKLVTSQLDNGNAVPMTEEQIALFNREIPNTEFSRSSPESDATSVEFYYTPVIMSRKGREITATLDATTGTKVAPKSSTVKA